MPASNICVIGLGSMGMGAAQSCIRAGLATWGVDLNPQACETLRQAGARDAQSSAHAFAEHLDAVLLLVVNARQVNAILFGEQGLAARLKPGTAVMVSSTLSAQDAQQIAARLADCQLLMLDAPVSGGAAKAASGEMTVMASGSDAAFAALQPVLDAVAAKVYRVGTEIGQDRQSKSFISCWRACTLPPGPKPWRWPPAPGFRSIRCMRWSLTQRATHGCLKTVCAMSSTATIDRNPQWTSLSKT